MAISRPLVTSLVLAALMLSAGLTAKAVKPTHYLADALPTLTLEIAIPSRFGDWHQLPNQAGLVNPQAQTLLNQIYSQVLNRSYVNSRGDVIMLSIAYGRDQSDNFQAHLPEICYPAQGFQLLSERIGKLATTYGDIPVRQLETRLNAQRVEPVTYWLTIGDQHTLGGTDKKLKEIKYNLDGQIPDGLLFRISSINDDSQQAFLLQENFARELITRLPTTERIRLTGLNK